MWWLCNASWCAAFPFLFLFFSHYFFSYYLCCEKFFIFLHTRRHSFLLFTHSVTYSRSLACFFTFIQHTIFCFYFIFLLRIFFLWILWMEREREEEEKEKNVFIRRRDAKRLLTDKHQELFVRDIYWDIIFTSLILCFSILFSLLAFRLARLWHFFPDILNTAHIYIICSSLGLETLFSSFPIFFIQLSSFNSSCYCCCWEIRCNLTFSSLSLPLFIFSTAFQDVMCAKGISPLKHMMTYKHT